MRIQYSNFNIPNNDGCGCGCLSLLLIILMLPVIFIMQALKLKTPARKKPDKSHNIPADHKEQEQQPHPKAADDIIDVTAKEID